MNNSPFDAPAIQTRLQTRVLQIRSAWLQWSANPTEGNLEDKRLETWVALLDARAEVYLGAVTSPDLLPQFLARLQRVGCEVIQDAEQRGHLSDPYCEERLREIAESSSNYISKRHFLTAEQQELLLQAEIESTRMGLRNRALEWHAWKTNMLMRIELLFEAQYAHWMAKAIEQVERLAESKAQSQRYPHTSLQVTNWEQIEILFLSDERVQIRVGERRETCNYSELGLADGRNQKPKQAWSVLRALAEKGGTLQTSPNWPKVEKCMQEIRSWLRRYFGLPGDPLPLIQGIGYRALLKIRCGPSYHS